MPYQTCDQDAQIVTSGAGSGFEPRHVAPATVTNRHLAARLQAASGAMGGRGRPGDFDEYGSKHGPAADLRLESKKKGQEWRRECPCEPGLECLRAVRRVSASRRARGLPAILSILPPPPPTPAPAAALPCLGARAESEPHALSPPQPTHAPAAASLLFILPATSRSLGHACVARTMPQTMQRRAERKGDRYGTPAFHSRGSCALLPARPTASVVGM